jgi:hypothetical protein
VSAANKGADAVVVGSGLAYDAQGRPLRLCGRQTVAVPRPIPAGGLILWIRIAAGPEGGCRADSSGEGMDLAWENGRVLDPSTGVPLARLLPLKEGWGLDSHFQRPASSPEARPRLVYGATLGASTPWRVWERSGVEASYSMLQREDEAGPVMLTMQPTVLLKEQEQRYSVRYLGLQVQVDASAAGFTRPPCYLAWLEGELWDPALAADYLKRYFPSGASALARVGLSAALLQLLDFRFGHIDEVTQKGFIYRLWLPQAAKWIHSSQLFDQVLVLAQEGGLSLSWLGIQMYE